MSTPEIFPIRPRLPEDAPPVAGKHARPGLRAAIFWVLVAATNLGLIAAAFYGGTRLVGSASPSAPEEAVAEPPAPEPAVVVRAEAAASPVRFDLREVDRLFRTGRYEEALSICRPASAGAANEARDGFAYREALCLEALGRWDDAVEAYARVSSRATAPPLVSAAQLGQARVWLRLRRPTAAKALLCDLVLRAGDPALPDPSLMADARYALALALALATDEGRRASFPERGPVGLTVSDWPLDGALAWADRPKGAAPKPHPAAAPEKVVVKRYGPGDEELLVTACVRETPLTSLVGRVAEQARLRVEWSAAARQRVEGRKSQVFLGPLPFADFLRPICDNFDLTWKSDKGTLRFSSREESGDGGAAGRNLLAAQRALGEAVLHSPRHPLTPGAFLELGNLEARRGRLDAAMGWYRRLIREWPRSPLVTVAHYDRGLIQGQAGKNAAARQSFYQVVDRAPAHELAPLAYHHIGRLHLEDFEPDQALSPLRRALASCNAATRAVVAQTTAAAYLLANNPRAANRTLVEHRTALIHPDHVAATAFLDTLARYRMCTDAKKKRLEMNDLLACVLTSRERPPLGPTGRLLLAQAHQEVGLHDLLIRFALEALPGLRGPLAVEMNAILAETYFATGKRPQAAKLYAELEAAPGRHATAARLRLAEIAHREGNPKDCLIWCKKALEKPEPGTRKAALRLMAASYESTGQRDKAILCLTGTPP